MLHSPSRKPTCWRTSIRTSAAPCSSLPASPASLLVVAALIAEFALRRHTVRMVSAIQRMDDSIYDQPSGPLPGGELGQVMRALDRMADAIPRARGLAGPQRGTAAPTIENAPSVAIQWYDRDAICRYWNPASTAIYGFTRAKKRSASLVGMFWTETQKDEFVALVREIERTGEPAPRRPSSRCATRTAASSRCSRRCSRFPMHGGRQFVCLDIDITERKARRERTVRQPAGTGNDLQRLTSANVGSPISRAAAASSRSTMPGYASSGYASSDAFGRTGSGSACMSPEDRGRFMGRFTAGVGAYDDMELWLQHADGAQFLARVSARVVEVAGQRLMLMASGTSPKTPHAGRTARRGTKRWKPAYCSARPH